MYSRDLKATHLLKANIDAMLKARNQTRHDLAVWCRRSDAWLSKIMSESETRNVQLVYLDRIADFFGIATYQLFQPGISPLSERRKGRDRRSGRDRRITAAVLSEKRGDVDVMQIIRALSQKGRERAIGLLADILNDEIRPQRSTSESRGAPDRRDESGEVTPAPKRGRKKHNG